MEDQPGLDGMDPRGKVAIVTGASSGIGRATARPLTAHGAKVALMHLENMGPYAAIKAALAHLSLTARAELATDRINVGVVYPYITQTDFETNTIRDLHPTAEPEATGSFQPPEADTAGYAAERILHSINTNAAEVFAHDWMSTGT